MSYLGVNGASAAMFRSTVAVTYITRVGEGRLGG